MQPTVNPFPVLSLLRQWESQVSLESGLAPEISSVCRPTQWHQYTVMAVLDSILKQYLPEQLRDEDEINTTARQLFLGSHPLRKSILDRVSSIQYSQFTQTSHPSTMHKVSFKVRTATDIGDTPPLSNIEKNLRGLNAQDCCRNTPLSLAVYFRNTTQVEALLNDNAHPNIPNSLGITPLHISVTRKLPSATLQLLYQYGANPNHQDIAGNTPLHYACREGLTILAELLIGQLGADIDRKNNRAYTPLGIASVEGHSDIVEKLILAGAHIDIRSTLNRTALFFAVMSGHVDCVRFLITAGANTKLKDDLNYTPMDLALQKKETSQSTESKEKLTEIIDLLSKDDEVITASQFPISNMLLNSCRNKTRQLLNSSPRYQLLTRKVGLLPLPESLKNYLQALTTPSSSDEQRLHP